MVVPTRHRDALNLLSEGRLTLTLSLERCLWMFPRPAWETTRAEIMEWPLSAKPVQRIVLGNATDVEMDGNGRLLISPELRNAAGIRPETKVMLVGMGSHFEIWDAAAHEANQEKAMSAGLPDELKGFRLR